MRRPLRFSRVVLGPSGEAGSAAFATAAAQIAGSFNAELAGLFVEDETVLSIADLPFCVEIALAGSARRYRRSDAEEAFRVDSLGARLSLERAARAALVRFSFTRVRGAVQSVLEQTASASDIVVFVEPERAIERACTVNSAYLAAALASKGSLLYVPALARNWAGGVGACLTGHADREVLHAAVQIASTRDARLTVIAPEGAAWRELLAEIVSDTGGSAPTIEERRFDPSADDALLRVAAQLPDALLVTANEPARLSSPEALRRLASGRRAPLLLIEPEGSPA